MEGIGRRAGAMGCAAAATAVGLFLLGFGPWSELPTYPLSAGYLALVLAAGAASILDPRRSDLEGNTTLRVSFVSDFGALLLFGPLAMTLVAVIGAIVRSCVDWPRSHPVRRVVLDVVTAVATTQAAGVAFVVLGGSAAPFAWPWQGVPIAAAVVAHCLVTSAAADLLVPLVTSGTSARPWPRYALRGCPDHFMAAGIAVAFVEAIGHRVWGILPVAAVPLYCAWRAYVPHASRLASQQRCLDAVESSDDAVAAVDDSGRVTRWNGALARLLDCPRDRALGRVLTTAVPTLGQSELPGAVHDALTNRRPRVLPDVEIRSDARSRTLHVTILPDAAGAMIFWRDVTEHAHAEQALRQSAERLARVAQGAHDGLWDLDVRTQELYVSERWRAIIGLAPPEGGGRAEDWFDRVHPDDLAGLKQVLAACAAGQAGPLEHEHRIRHDDGTYRRVRCRGISVRDDTRRSVRMAGSLTDITESAIARDQVLSAGLRDSLTGLANRAAFVEGLGRHLDDLQQRHGGRFAVLYLDLDRFKIVNDSLGHMVGDDLIVAVSRRLESCLRPGDSMARLGGDEFAILLKGLGDEMQANVVAFRIQEALTSPFSIGGREVVTSASIGIAFSRLDYGNPEEIMRDADTAMYRAKARGKARHELFDADMHARAIDRLGLESDLRLAVKSTGFEVHYQPIVSLESRMCTGFEALVRWTRNGKAVSPADFIPVAEELGLIEPLGTWVLQEACRTFAGWQKRFPDCELDCITVNVSTRQLVQQGFMYLVEQTLLSAGMKPCHLRLEVTETALMDAPQLTAQVLGELREFGVKIYLDDFGTGYSSLSHLHKLPVDALKIDRSFVRGLLLDDRPAIVESILALARTLNTGVVAEGVEDELQASKLERLGCSHAQGYYFSRPLPTRSVEVLLAARRPLGESSERRMDLATVIREDAAPFAPAGRTDWPAHAGVQGLAVG